MVRFFKDIELNKIKDKIRCKKLGLKYIPSIGEALDKEDFLPQKLSKNPPRGIDGNGQFSSRNFNALKNLISQFENPECFIEIGVARIQHIKNSSTSAFLDFKKSSCVYIGIDKEPVELQEQPDLHCFFKDCRVNKGEIIQGIIDFGIKGCEILHIDGFHSIEMMLNDLEYASKFLKVGGFLVVHDTNFHPGPRFVCEALDPSIYDGTFLFDGYEDDLGLGVFKKLK